MRIHGEGDGPWRHSTSRHKERRHRLIVGQRAYTIYVTDSRQFSSSAGSAVVQFECRECGSSVRVHSVVRQFSKRSDLRAGALQDGRVEMADCSFDNMVDESTLLRCRFFGNISSNPLVLRRLAIQFSVGISASRPRVFWKYVIKNLRLCVSTPSLSQTHRRQPAQPNQHIDTSKTPITLQIGRRSSDPVPVCLLWSEE